MVDAVAGETREIHDAAVQRLVQAGAVPVTWLSVASELQGTYENLATVEGFTGLMAEHSPTLGMYLQHYSALQSGGAVAA
ncbi:hypothetical protein ACWC4C_43370 [Streptomyces olivaceoviridis]